jgi:hypothetical protein
MIDTQGKPHDIAVAGSNGVREYESAASAKVFHCKWLPGTRAARSIDARGDFHFFYWNSLDRRNSKGFAPAYNAFVAAVTAGDKVKADTEISRLQEFNIFDGTLRNYSQFLYDRNWGGPAQQLEDLRALSAVSHIHTLCLPMCLCRGCDVGSVCTAGASARLRRSLTHVGAPAARGAGIAACVHATNSEPS